MRQQRIEFGHHSTLIQLNVRINAHLSCDTSVYLRIIFHQGIFPITVYCSTILPFHLDQLAQAWHRQNPADLRHAAIFKNLVRDLKIISFYEMQQTKRLEMV